MHETEGPPVRRRFLTRKDKKVFFGQQAQSYSENGPKCKAIVHAYQHF